MLCYILYYIILYYNLMGQPSNMRSVVERNVVMSRMTVYLSMLTIASVSAQACTTHFISICPSCCSCELNVRVTSLLLDTNLRCKTLTRQSM